MPAPSAPSLKPRGEAEVLRELAQLGGAGAPGKRVMGCRATQSLPGQRHSMSIMSVLAVKYLGVGACAVLSETAA